MQTLIVQNLKCHGCANTITKALKHIKGIENVSVEVESSTVHFDSDNEQVTENVKSKLAKLGYPIIDADNTQFQKIKSYISCAVGRIDVKNEN